LSVVYTGEDPGLLRRLGKAWEKPLSCLHRASQLNSINLLVNDDYLNATVSAVGGSRRHRRWPRDAYKSLQAALLYSMCPITINPGTYPFLTSLTIADLSTRTSLSEVSNLECIAARLEYLCISISMLSSDEMLEEFMDTFFWEELTDRLLKPATNLRTLSLISDSFAGVTPIIKFNDLTYPFLESLYLRYIQFREKNKEAGIEGMIWRSRSTLRYLKLDKCLLHRVGFIYNWEESVLEGFERRWADVWTSFSDELNNLHELVVRGMERVSDRYQMSEGRRISTNIKMITDEDESRDAAALEMLCQVVRSKPDGRAVIGYS
jgi:hypothetical protein